MCDWPTSWPSASEKFLIHVIFSSSTGKLAKFDEIMGKISAMFLARKKKSITVIVNYELRLILYSNRVKGWGWNIYKFLVERKPPTRILWRHLKWRWKQRKGDYNCALGTQLHVTIPGVASVLMGTTRFLTRRKSLISLKKNIIVWQFKSEL